MSLSESAATGAVTAPRTDDPRWLRSAKELARERERESGGSAATASAYASCREFLLDREAGRLPLDLRDMLASWEALVWIVLAMLKADAPLESIPALLGCLL